MPKLIYLYTSGGAPMCDPYVKAVSYPFWEYTKTHNRFATAAPSDGMVNMFKVLSDTDHIDHLCVFVDSTRSPGSLQLGSHARLFVTPSIAAVLDYIRPGDILVVRGGFKAWYPLLNHLYKKRQNWILFYRANTNRHPWPFWDIILNDLIDEPKSVRGRLHFPFSKPVNEDIFGVIDAPNTIPKEYDVMVGASHIHKKKGQHITLQALKAYYRLFGTKPKAILPGGFMRGWTTQLTKDILKSGDVDVEGPVSMTRQQLALAMNRSRLFVHPGYGGQNDRGILEAMACGCLPLIFGQKHVSPTIWDHSVWITQEPNDIAQTIRKSLWMVDTYDRSTYQRINGLRTVCLPKFISILDFIKQNPIPDRSAACKYFKETYNVRLRQSL